MWEHGTSLLWTQPQLHISLKVKANGFTIAHVRPFFITWHMALLFLTSPQLSPIHFIAPKYDLHFLKKRPLLLLFCLLWMLSPIIITWLIASPSVDTFQASGWGLPWLPNSKLNPSSPTAFLLYLFPKYTKWSIFYLHYFLNVSTLVEFKLYKGHFCTFSGVFSTIYSLPEQFLVHSRCLISNWKMTWWLF